jgi:predicted amidohydrolase
VTDCTLFHQRSCLMTLIVFSAVDPGMQILPPFDTPVGKVGSTICFDVSVAHGPAALLALTVCSCGFPRSASP